MSNSIVVSNKVIDFILLRGPFFLIFYILRVRKTRKSTSNLLIDQYYYLTRSSLTFHDSSAGGLEPLEKQVTLTRSPV